MKPVYNCFIWQISLGLSEQMMRYIEESERLAKYVVYLAVTGYISCDQAPMSP